MSFPRRNKIIIDLQVTYTGYKVIETDPIANRRTRTSNIRPQSIPERKSWNVDAGRIGGLEDPFKHLLSAQTAPSLPASHITLPVSTAWLDLSKVHEIERKALPQFFKNVDSEKIGPFKKSERLYTYYRNTIISMWRENTKKYLPASACRKNLLGDVCSIVRVHAFLENWGIINFPSREIKGPIVKRETLLECHVCSNMHSKFYVYEEGDIQFWTCFKCFQSQFYPKFMASELFRKVDVDQPKQDDWTPAQTLKLLELLQSRDRQNWTEIVKEFPGRTKQQIVMHFLKCPTLRLSKSSSIFQNGQDIKGYSAPSFPPNIFGDYRNPVQIAIAVLLKEHAENPTPETTELFETLAIHSQFLQKKQQARLDRQMKLLTDLAMNKVECKVVYLHEYSLLVDLMGKNVEQQIPNYIAQILKEAIR